MNYIVTNKTKLISAIAFIPLPSTVYLPEKSPTFLTIADYSEGYYILSFKNGILVEWFKEKTPINNNTAN